MGPQERRIDVGTQRAPTRSRDGATFVRGVLDWRFRTGDDDVDEARHDTPDSSNSWQAVVIVERALALLRETSLAKACGMALAASFGRYSLAVRNAASLFGGL